MSRFRSSLRIALAGLGLVLAHAGAQAALTTYFAAQDPKPLPDQPEPPALSPAVLSEIGKFNTAVKPLGRGEFESGSTLDFSYTGGTAHFVGNPTLPQRIDGSVASTGLGRYNTTPGLFDQFGDPLWGHWIEAVSDFSITFDGAPVQGLSFLGTDFFDFEGTLSYSLWRNGQSLGGGSIQTQGSSPSLNGSLLFFGVSSTEAFDEIRFDVSQGSTTDALGFDSFVVGALAPPVDVPEPTSLALAGLALCGLALGRRRARRA